MRPARRNTDTQELPIITGRLATATTSDGCTFRSTVGGEFEGEPTPGDNYWSRNRQAHNTPVFADLRRTQELPAFEG